MINDVKTYLKQKLHDKRPRPALTHREARKQFKNYMRGVLGHFFREVDPGPVGDEELIKRTAVLKAQDVQDRTSPETYFRSGYLQMLDWMKLLENHGFNLRTVAAVFELGCGTARLLRHLRCMDGVRLVGSDVNLEMIDWCKKSAGHRLLPE